MCLQIMPFGLGYLCLLYLTVFIQQGKNAKSNPNAKKQKPKTNNHETTKE